MTKDDKKNKHFQVKRKPHFNLSDRKQLPLLKAEYLPIDIKVQQKKLRDLI
jgi:hypothetical protein